MVDSPGFKRFTDDVLQFGYMAGLNAAKNKSNFSAPNSSDFLPNGQTVSRYIGDCVNERLPVFVEFLKTNIRKHGASIAIDIPTHGSSLVGFSISFIDDSWRYHNYLLDLQEIDLTCPNNDINSESIKDGLNRLLLRYGLFTENRNIVIVINKPKMILKGFSNVKCVCNFLEDLSNFVFWQKKDETIQLPHEVKEELIRINSLIVNLMDIVNVLKKRPELKNNLSSRFSQDFDSRVLIWKSCLERFLNLTEIDYQSIRDIFATHPTLISKLGVLLGSRQILSLCLTAIEPIHNLLKKYEKLNKPSLHMVIVDLMNLKKNYQAKSNSEMNMIKAVGVAVTKFMCDKLDEFLENYHTSAMILDPGHKNQLRFLVDEERFQKAKDNFKSTVNSFRVKLSIPYAQEDLDSFDGLHSTDDDPLEQEIKTYLSLKKDSVEGFPAVLDFWKVNERQFPTISKFARKILCIPASSISSEEVYKVFNKTMTKGRNAIECDTVSKIVSTIFLQKFAQSMS
uniref:HAT C-terminal dimerisation domain-containing protein n=1 Tax=Acrobeloides nanus TaxID=290746 RepID=A0A914ERT0_9BILA